MPQTAHTHGAYCHHEPATVPASGSRRRRLWDLGHACHCPLVGVSLPMDTLRRLVQKALGAGVVANDYEVHAGAVTECGRRCKLSELMQAELDARYVREIQVFRAAKSALAVAELWIKYVKAGDVAGAFWAALSHPRCDVPLQEAMCKDLHMFQHQAGAGVRLEMAKFNVLADENAVLARELGKVQERITRVMAQKATDVEQLNAQLLQARAEGIAKDSRIAFMAHDLEALQASIPQLEDKQRLQKRLDQMAQRQTELEAQNADLRRKLVLAEKAAAERAATAAASREAVLSQGEGALAGVQAMVIQLHQKMVLCVGGRSGNIANYRDVVERVGGRFTHHDGGLEDNSNVLDANLAAADLVICQTGCISHNAYWRVKDFCKRTGKRCVFVENPSASSLERGLAQITTSKTAVAELVVSEQPEAL
ncbi:DUF2325 domain-containing protein [Rhodoferax saidenbachensis]|uniref:DUF2325 domain-containing protein n=1 Tax=Rhodoferax saidenbachensis TaxID=1484693 RepID=A0A1P8K988_9BURK|nr:DUF2325 domain-containing protein [Rhodoferax saidenbachensis]APW42569.1 DUF2325 domain-containing protein [Rhodoferax saidenbachensis]